MKIRMKMLPAILLAASLIWKAEAATNNSGQPPAFIMIDVCSNGLGDPDGSFDAPRFQPDVFDIGLDIGADGTIDRWLSKEPAMWFGGGNSDQINHAAWRRFYFFQLDEHTGKQMRLRIVDRSAEYYIAINTIRVNGADGKVVPNPIRNGFFEAANALEGWTVKETSVADPAKLIVSDPTGKYVSYGAKFLSTMTNPESGDFSEKAVLESDTFTLTPVTSFIYGNVSGGGSEFVNLPGANGSDNKSGVYLDLGTAAQDPNGQYDPGSDVALEGFWGGAAGGGANDFGSIFINTSGLEGRRAQIVGFDDSTLYHVTLDAFRANWDWEEKILRNGGFDEGIPTPQSHPNATTWFDEVGNALKASDHPSGAVPGWKVNRKANATGNAWFFDGNARKDHMSGRTFVGTGGGDLTGTGVEIRSDVFVIQAIPNATENVFVQFASAQGTDRTRYQADGSDIAFGRVELIIDVNGNGQFGDASDFRYVQRNQAMAPNQSNSGRDLWHHPEYRWYIRPEHQGLKAVFRAEDHYGTFKASWGWLCIDDLFVWDGKTAQLAFPNSDFEKGTLENWTAEISVGSGFDTWLSGSKKALDAGKVQHSTMNNRSVDIDGDYAADTAARETGGGDNGMGVLTSMAFTLPKLASTGTPGGSTGQPGTGSGPKLFFENFEGLALGRNLDEALVGEKVWTKKAPAGWLADDSGVPGVGDKAQDGVTEWAGWSFADKSWWTRTAGDQRRSEFLFGQGAVMIADPDEWDDAGHKQGLFNTYVSTPPINVTGQAVNSLVLAFDSSWRPEAFDDGAPSFPVGPDGEKTNNQTGVITVSFDGARPIEVLRWDSDSSSPTYHADGDFINEAVLVPIANSANAKSMVVKFGMEKAANDWWWAVDNIAIGVPPLVTGIAADGVSFSLRISEALNKKVDEAKGITMELDGKAVTGAQVTRDGERIMVKYTQAPEVFPPSSRHEVKVKFTTAEGKQVQDTAEFVAPSYTTISATPLSATATITDTDWLTVDQAKGVQLELDGKAVAAASVARSDKQVLVRYAQADIFESNSKHTLKLTFTTATGKQIVDSVEFAAPEFTTVPAALGTAPGTGSQPGLRWRTHQLDAARGNAIALAEQQLAGKLGPSVHDAGAQGTDGVFAIDYVNFDQASGEAGNFKSSGTPPQNIDDLAIPGIPGMAGDNNVAGEARTFLEFRQAGLYTMVVNSDDGFQVSTGTTNNPTQLVLGQLDGGRGAADSIFYFKVEKPGVYFLRLLWFEGTGGASVEWFTINADGSRALVNGAQPGALKAFRVRTVPEPAALPPPAKSSIAFRNGKVEIQFTGTLKASATVVGPYQPVSGATSPYQVTPTDSARFFIAQ